MASPTGQTASVFLFYDAGSAKAPAPTRSIVIARILLVATLLAAPLAFGAVQPWAWGSLALMASLLLLLWAIGGVQQGFVRILPSPLYLPAALFLLLGGIQFLGDLTLDHIATREALLKLVTYLLFFFLASQLLVSGSRKTMRRFALSITIYVFLMALFAILQVFSSHGTIYWVIKTAYGPFGPYVNRNHYAGLMEMLIPIAAAYVLSRPRNHPGKTLLGFAVLLPIASLLLCGSRGGFAALLVEITILGAVFMGNAPRPTQRNLALVASLGITAAILLFLWMDRGGVSQRLASIAHPSPSNEATLGDRKVVASDSLHILGDHPWVGSGLGSFETAYPAYQSFPTDLAYAHAHNDYVEALAETGVAGGILILSALALFFWQAFRNLSERLRQDAGWLQLGAALGCCGLLVHSFVDFNLHIPANAGWFAVCAAIATIHGGAPNRTKHEVSDV